MQEKLPEWTERRAELEPRIVPTSSDWGQADLAGRRVDGVGRGAGAGEWPHGWQCHATRTRARYYRDRVLLPALSTSAQALLRSQAGPQAENMAHCRFAIVGAAPQLRRHSGHLRRLRVRMAKSGLVGQTCRKARSCNNTGSPTPYSHRTTDAWTLSCIERQRMVAHFAAMRPWCPLSYGRVTHSPAPLMGPPCKLERRRRPTPSSRAEARQHCWPPPFGVQPLHERRSPSVAVQLAVASTALGRSDSAELSWRPGFGPRR